jgi:hypothetical protein
MTMSVGSAKRILVGYDGSLAAGAAVEAAASLLPHARAWTVVVVPNAGRLPADEPTEEVAET